MNVDVREVTIPLAGDRPLLAHAQHHVLAQLPESAVPVAFAITRSDAEGHHAEVSTLEGPASRKLDRATIFELAPPTRPRSNSFDAVLVIPTGIGAVIGGHAGDAGPVARLLAGACDRLVTHPNVANAADINELPANAMYVEGSILSRLMLGTIGLRPVRSNRVLVVCEPHRDALYVDATVNMVSAARAAAGIDCPEVVVLPRRFSMQSVYARSGRGVGRLGGLEGIDEVLRDRRDTYDAVAVASLIEVPPEFHRTYFSNGIDDTMVNPWGGVEAMLTHTLSLLHEVPCAHAPMMSSRDVQGIDYGRVDPRKAAEPVSTTYLFSVLKGLSRSPQVVSLASGAAARSDTDLLTAADVACVVVPAGCLGLPVLGALARGTTVIEVRGNDNRMRNRLSDLPFRRDQLVTVDNYLEAAGVMTALRAGVRRDTVLRPLAPTVVTAMQT